MKDIQFSFGIATDGSITACNRLIDIFSSIKKLNIPNYEIILVGQKSTICSHRPHIENEFNIKIIDFNESMKSGWITRKKNLITNHAKYDNIVYSHDYIIYDENWYNGWKIYGDQYHACMNKMINIDGSRYRDWTIYADHEFAGAEQYSGWNRQKLENLIPYEETDLNRYQYFSGAYWVAKKSIMQEIPLDENLVWGQGEDLVWARSFRKKYKFSMNPHSSVKLLKFNHVVFSEMSPETLRKLKEYVRK